LARTGPLWTDEAFVRSLEERIAEIRRAHLEPLEQGLLHIGASGVDVTQREIDSLRRNIAGIEAVIAQYRYKDD
jgi:hypothetical protein